ncbi:MAG: glycosyltransferase family 2 protein [Clostridia bacterium]|nr:glycosyltransferase family 2 protein [Clostridia bacterium]
MQDNSNLRFSVIICAYNLEKIVNTAIKSVLGQSFENYELIIVNDGSTDNTLETLRKFEKKLDGKIKVIDNKKNMGLSASRNIAIKQAKGEYLVHLDGDDTLYDRETLAKIDATIGNRKLDICYFGVQYVGGGNKLYLPNAKNSTKEARIVCDMHFAVSSKVWRREFLEENDLTFIEGMYYEDMVYSIKAAIKAKEISFGAIPIYVYYRNREGSIMATPNIKRCKDMYKMLYYLMELYEETPEYLQPYLLSFIKNETFGVPARLDGILKSLKDSTYTPVFPKRNYVFIEDTSTIVEQKEEVPETDKSKIIQIPVQNDNLDNNSKKIKVIPTEPQIAASSKNDLKIVKF